MNTNNITCEIAKNHYKTTNAIFAMNVTLPPVTSYMKKNKYVK